MIFYFSGTGNSLYAAKTIAEYNNEELVSIATLMNKEDEYHEFNLKDNEIIGFVFPVYGWGPPNIVLQFIEKLRLGNYHDNYVFSVATCGDNIGNTIEKLGAALKKNGLELNSGFSVRMPNNYIIMFDVDPKNVETEKLISANETLMNINRIIAEREKGVYQVVKGFMPGVLTSIINPLFNKNAINTKKFYSTDKCTACGICEKVCNCNNIKVDQKPEWGNRCTQCFACIHYCPEKAIQYGKATEKKGRYVNPNVSIKEISN